MSDKQTAATLDRADPRNRRYVGVKETAAYVAFDMSQSFNIDGERDYFAQTILKIDLPLISLAKGINSVWDIANDLFTGAIVDRTRTRWGKFKPYLMFLAIPGTILALIYWLLPLFYGGTDPTNMHKFAAYLLLQIVSEGIGTFHGMARVGIQATITPFPADRTRLITVANLVSGALGEKLPGQILNLLIRQMRKGKLGGASKLPKLFTSMGVVTTIIGGAGAFWFFYVCKERINQSEEKPTIRQSINTILHNKPILLLTLSETLGGLDVGVNKSDYCRDVLDDAFLKEIVGIPAVLINPVSYAMVPWFRRHFSDRTLFILGNNCISLMNLPVFLFGCIGGKKKGLYKKVLPMAIAMTLHESMFTFLFGVRSVIPTEMRNESMDYCEWKNGYRGEGMISITKGLSSKLTGAISGVIGPLVKSWFHYDQDAFTAGKQQSDETKFALFTLYTLIPAVFTVLSSIPMLFYKLDGEERDRMYAELQERRAAMTAIESDEA